MASREQEARREWLKCSASAAYFIDTYCHIEDVVNGRWETFRLWPAQAVVLDDIQNYPRLVLLKARQLGMTWLVLGYVLWLILFRPAATVGLFSRREEEAIDLLDRRLKGMYQRLPDWMKARAVVSDSKKFWELSNGSWVRAFPSNAGDSYTYTLAVIDEADLVPDLSLLLGGVEPAIAPSGQMVLLGRSDKSHPQSRFKQIYRAAKQGLNEWRAVFMPWSARPGRDAAWYAAQKRESIEKHGSLDYLHEQFPATDTEALAPRSLDKRIPAEWLERCYEELAAIDAQPTVSTGSVSTGSVSTGSVSTGSVSTGSTGGDALRAPAIPGLEIFEWPDPGRAYVMGADTSEGNPTSDPSALEVLDSTSGDQVARLKGLFQPKIFASHIDAVGQFYNDAPVLVERNNHGHVVIGWLEDHSELTVLQGRDDKPGWHTTSLGKVLLYDEAAEAFRAQETMIHSFETYTQLASIEGASLSAPSGEHDDDAMAYVLALMGRLLRPRYGTVVASAMVRQAEMIFG